MKTVLKVAGVVVACLLLIGGAAYGWASVTTDRAFSRAIDTHSIDFPIPFPLAAEEVEELELTDEEAREVALERARERGRHLVQARYACGECHGDDFSGGVMVDAFPIGRLLGPNLTGGEGGVTGGYTAADWDRIVRHGVLPDGRPAVMPSEDFQLMSDQELSDIIVFLSSQPPIDNQVPPPSFGPLGRMLVATGEIHLSADLIDSHTSSHTVLPPAAEVSVEFGRHLAGVCVGCHGQDYAGGPIAGGDPSWAAARNLTPHESGLAGWSYEDFARAMLDEVRPDGSPVQLPMTMITPYAREMTEVELRALWRYLQSVPPVPTG